MIKILISDDNIDNIKKIVNHLSIFNDYVNINISCNENETFRQICLKRPDLVVANSEIFNFNKFENFKNIRKDIKSKFLIYNFNENLIRNLPHKQNILKIFFTENSINEIIKEIDNFIKNINKENLEKEILNELIYLGYIPTHKGTIFLLDILELLLNKKEIYDFNLNSEIYPIISKKYNEKINAIKVNIFRATEEMYYNCEETKLYNYFQIDGKPNIKNIIFTICNNIKNKKGI